MIHIPSMVLIGATGRNVGKTEFACGLIHRLAAQQAVFAAKVTAIREQGGTCPRGGDGCGVCGSLQGDFEITAEHNTLSGKDTSRMLQAGAKKVLWLRVRHAQMEPGMRALLAMLPPDVPIICESNSLREVLAPGQFVVVRDSRTPAIKESCRRVIPLASRLITFDGSGWDLQPDELNFAQGHWWWRMNATAIILAGGQSRRMGQDKSLLPFHGRPMLVHIADQLRPHFRFLLVGANDPQRYGVAGVPVIADCVAGQGPLMGLASCLEATTTDVAFLTGCDIPNMDLPTLYRMQDALHDHDAVIPVTADGRHPLFAFYRRTILPTVNATLSEGKRRMDDIFDRISVAYFPIADNTWFRNLNTPADYAAACAVAGSPPALRGTP
ncbi:MAG: NTP transferase domain-containing protein [Kiritimatiellia bacterium]